MAAFCENGCGSFNGVWCADGKGHLSLPGVKACTSCGRTDLTTYAPSINLRPAIRCIAWIIAIGLVKALFFHAPAMASSAAQAGGWSLEHLFGVELGAIRHVIDAVISWSLIVLLFSVFLPKPYGGLLRSGYFQLLRLAAQWGWKGVTLIGRLLYRLVEGRITR